MTPDQVGEFQARKMTVKITSNRDGLGMIRVICETIAFAMFMAGLWFAALLAALFF